MKIRHSHTLPIRTPNEAENQEHTWATENQVVDCLKVDCQEQGPLDIINRYPSPQREELFLQCCLLNFFDIDGISTQETGSPAEELAGQRAGLSLFIQ